MRRLVPFVAACCLLSGCSDIASIFASKPPDILPGKRIPVLTQNNALEVDSTAHSPITLPEPDAFVDWAQPGVSATHNPQHLALADNPQPIWTVNLGAGENPRMSFNWVPIVAEHKIFAADALGVLSAVDINNGQILWQQDLMPTDNGDPGDGSFGGGATYVDGRLFVTNGYAEVVALNAGTGQPIWRHRLLTPARGAPVVMAGRVFLVTVENEAVALAADDGHEIWHHNGIGESTNLLGTPSPAAEGNTVVVPYTSGELFALHADTGAVQWTDLLASVRRTDQVAELTDIKALPIIDHGKVYAIGNSDMLTSIDLRSGRRLWDREVGSLQTPWLAGGFLFVVTGTPSIACFEADTGKVRWIQPLTKWEEPDDKEGRINWSGPVLAGGSLLLVSSEGNLLRVSPQTGEIQSEQMISDDGFNIPPIVAEKTLLLIDRNGILHAFR